MTTGLLNTTNVSIESLTGITNYTNPAEMMVYINHVIFNDYLFYILFWLFAVILFIAAQQIRKEPLSNGLYVCAIVSIPALLARGVQAFVLSDMRALLTDHQFWTFPLLTALFAALIWATKK